MRICLTTGNVNFDHLVKAVSVKTPHCKITSYVFS